MKADNVTLQGILNSPNRYLIPVFQRYYAWGKKEWKQLWENVQELCDPDEDGDGADVHFMGSLVFVPDTYTDHTMPTYQVIDGQQRLITLSIMLCAVRNIARSNQYHELAAEITDTFLVHPYKREMERYRVYPRQRDRDEYVAILEHKPFPGSRSRLTSALIFFLRLIQKQLRVDEEISEAAVRGFLERIKIGLQFVYINLNEENPYRIFKSLNSTGMNLSESDLIRNFMLMSVGSDTAEQDHFDDHHWRPLEELFVDDQNQLDSRAFSTFFRDFLMASGRFIPLSSTFYHFERRYHKPGFDPRPLTANLNVIAEKYNAIRGLSSHQSEEINRALHKVRLVQTNAAYPLLLNLLLRCEEKKITVEDFVNAVDLIRIYVADQTAANNSSRSVSRRLVTASRFINQDPVRDLAAYFDSR